MTPHEATLTNTTHTNTVTNPPTNTNTNTVTSADLEDPAVLLQIATDLHKQATTLLEQLKEYATTKDPIRGLATDGLSKKNDSKNKKNYERVKGLSKFTALVSSELRFLDKVIATPPLRSWGFEWGQQRHLAWEGGWPFFSLKMPVKMTY